MIKNCNLGDYNEYNKCNKYNKIEHLKLLKRSLELKKQNKRLSIEDEMKLYRQNDIIISNFFWQKKDQFIILIENFLNNSINLEEFDPYFSHLWNTTIIETKPFYKDIKQVENFKPDPILNKFPKFCNFGSLQPDL
uniref:Uncharacterized protein n=1 Tax=Amicula sp. isolate GU52X-4 cfCalB7 TaxID=3003489 RepID=A0A9E8YZC2_9STRA|nr:hypothetical protein [Amicula sp. isolate GU52X-4 cfCalB7]WAK84980.1 hypothetical protein [Amicula sp. isolate GU52X-4 cfCalB7]